MLKKKINMNSTLLMFLVFCISCFSNTPLAAQKNRAQVIFEDNLTFLSSFIVDNDVDSTFKTPNIISFFEKWTSIESESDGTFFGKLSPTVSDIENWRKWYNINKDKLVWDSTTSTILIRER